MISVESITYFPFCRRRSLNEKAYFPLKFNFILNEIVAANNFFETRICKTQNKYHFTH